MSKQLNNHESDSENEEEQTTPKQSPKNTRFNTDDLLATLGLESENDADRSIGMFDQRVDQSVFGGRVAGQFYESPHLAFDAQWSRPAKTTHQETQTFGDMGFEFEEFDVPMKLAVDIGLDDGPSQMMEESYDGTELGFLEPDEFEKSTAVISTRSADDVLNAVQNTLAILQSKGLEVVYENEGYAFDVNFTHDNKTCDLEILLLETGDDHPTPGNIAILYNKLNGNGFSFQRFYRESVASLANDLSLELRALNGGHLPTMEVMADEFTSSDVDSSKHVAESMNLSYQALIALGGRSVVEPLRETTATLLSIAAQYPQQVLEFCAGEKRFVMNMTLLMKTHHNDQEVSRNLLRFFNEIIKEELLYSASGPHVYEICKQVIESHFFEYGLKAGSYWMTQKGEKTGLAKLICNDVATFVDCLAKCYFSQGVSASKGARVLFNYILSQKGSDFEGFRSKMSSLLPRLN